MISLDCNVRVVDFVKGMEIESNGDYTYPELPSNSALNLEGTFTFEYDYPLSKQAKFEHVLTPDMTGMDLLVLGRVDYERIYQEEDADMGYATPMIPGMMNRA